MDRRITFFLVAAAVCAVMTPLAPSELRWVPTATAVAYVVLAVLVVLETVSGRSRRGAGDDDATD